MRASPEMQSAWTEYWKGGPTESLPADRASGLLDALDTAWADFFSGLPGGARVLDLASGGGDVVRKAAAAGRDFEIAGVDIADLSAVSATMPSGRIKLAGNTDLSSLPFADTSFDAVTSQFGFEYADVAAASREAVRVMAPGARGLFILHHADSAITQGALNSQAAYRAVFPDNSAFQKCGRDVFERYEKSASRAETLVAETQFRKAVVEAQSRIVQDRAFVNAHKVVGFLTRPRVRAHFYSGGVEALHQLQVVEHHNEARELRKGAQIKAALDAAGVNRIAALLETAGAAVQPITELRYLHGKILAWSLPFGKQA